MNQQDKLGEYLQKFVDWWLWLMTSCINAVKNFFQDLKQGLKPLTDKLKPLFRKIGEGIGHLIAGISQKLWDWTAAIKAKLSKGKKPAENKPPVTQRIAGHLDFVKTGAEKVKATMQKDRPFIQNIKEVYRKSKPYLRKVGAALASIGRGIKLVVKWIWKLRSVFLSIPVVWMAVKLAIDNMNRLPESVGLDIQSTGEFARVVSRNWAVYGPLGVTLFCIVLTLCSKKPLLPWVISIFSLVLPLLIWITNYYA